jgi:NAD(P)-dependent dehydrogenase (short-subunit alcohol dehydrogenase family)
MPTALITGTNSGFGLATAIEFLRRGDNVAAGMRRPSRGSVLMDVARDLPGELDIVQLDVTDPDERTAAVEHTVQRFGQIDVLVNNAGISHISALEDTPVKLMEDMFAINVVGPLALAQKVLPHMRERRTGRIVNVTAIGAILCTPYLGAYVASKHALDAATAALDLEIRTFGIRAISLLPGPFKTSIVGANEEYEDDPAYRTAVHAFRSGLAERMATASDDLSIVADTIVSASFDPDPPPRIVVASTAMSDSLGPTLATLEQLHRLEASRLGIAASRPSST